MKMNIQTSQKTLVALVVVLLLNILNVNKVAAGQLHIVDTNTLTMTLNRIEDNKKILFFFTSWCPYCKNAIDEIVKSGKTEQILFISLDKDYEKISAMTSKMPESIDVYYMSSPEEILNVFRKFNIKYRDTIPHIAILDEDNRLIKDNVNIRQLYRYIR
jgi:thiol-disulfide isomerase/thioredoxin